MGLSNEQFGNRVGVTFTMASKLRRGKRLPSVNTLLRIRDEFDISADALLDAYAEGAEAFSGLLEREVFDVGKTKGNATTATKGAVAMKGVGIPQKTGACLYCGGQTGGWFCPGCDAKAIADITHHQYGSIRALAEAHDVDCGHNPGDDAKALSAVVKMYGNGAGFVASHSVKSGSTRGAKAVPWRKTVL